MKNKILIFLSLLLFACSEQVPAPGIVRQLQLSEVLGGDNVEGFQRAYQAREFNFPEDHAGHNGFRNEWWYVTGNLETQQGRHFAYQVTFFNTAVVPESSDEQNVDVGLSSAWSSNRIWMAHVAISDIENGQHIGVERFSRENPGLAGSQINPFKVWLENWSLQAENNNFPWQLSINDADIGLELSLRSEKDLVLQGVEGLSQKSPEPGNASYYYSFTRIQTEGHIRVGSQNYQVVGESWLDREWSSSALGPGQTGWDWFSLQFIDGQELMYYQLRDEQGTAHQSSQGNWTDSSAMQSLIRREDIVLEERQSWSSPAGISYGTEWSLSYRGNVWLVKAVMEDQLMEVSFQYWEGAVEVFDINTGDKVGRGYLEMVRE